jgi:hypothetical protein
VVNPNVLVQLANKMALQKKLSSKSIFQIPKHSPYIPNKEQITSVCNESIKTVLEYNLTDHPPQ